MTIGSKIIRVLCVGAGNMGRSHAIAYHNNPGFQVVGVVSRGEASREALATELGAPPVATFADFETALTATRPDAVCIASYTETHAPYAILALEAGAHVFCEKPLADTVANAEKLVATARRMDRKLVVGYILRQHPSWQKFVEIARTLGKPLVMRMNLNQQSHGATWTTHKNLMNTTSPIVDCGVHYIDVMCQMTGARPVRVHAIGVRMTNEVATDMYNYGQLQVVFDDGSVGWYEAGWGPMISEEAYFVKDVMGPGGAVSIVGASEKAPGSDNVDAHTATNRIRVHRSQTKPDGTFAQPDQLIDNRDEPDHQGLCDREQAFFLRAIRGEEDLTEHMANAVDSLRVVFAADESVRTGKVVNL